MPAENFDVALLSLGGESMRITDSQGNQLNDKDGKPKVALLRDAAIACLAGQQEDDKSLSAADRMKLIGLALKLQSGGEQQYTVDELSLIKTRAGKQHGLSHLEFYRLCEHIDAEPKAE